MKGRAVVGQIKTKPDEIIVCRASANGWNG